MIIRLLTQEITKRFFKNKAILLLGARQVGKTTLVNSLAKEYDQSCQFWNCDEPLIREFLEDIGSSELRQRIGSSKLVIIDEAQRVKNIGITAKLIVDQIRDVQLILTGSSSLELNSEISEPLTGRKYEYTLYPFSYEELVDTSSDNDQKEIINQRLAYGFYPDIVLNPGDEEMNLINLSSSYLFKDVLALREIRKADALDRLVKALALQIGSEVSYNELSRTIGLNKDTISKYIDMLEKSFVIFSLYSFSRNQRNELRKSKKIYFYDVGVRNSLIKNFNMPGDRTDVGPLWENFLVVERLKALNNAGKRVNSYFWRTVQKAEIDYVEEYGGNIYAYEFKWNPKAKSKNINAFKRMYPDAIVQTINSENFVDFILLR